MIDLVEEFKQMAESASMYKDDAAVARSRAFLQAASMLEDRLCMECKGTGLVTIFDHPAIGMDADDQPCRECQA
jgi:hypothetical protein